MFDSSLHAKTLARQFRRADFHPSSWNISLADKEGIIADALTIARRGFDRVSLRQNSLGDKTIYRHGAISEALLIRHVADGVRRITGVRQSDRKGIMKSLVAVVGEGIPFGVLKFDIRSFYESVDPFEIISSLRADAAFSRQSVDLLESFFGALQRQGVHGLPRGIGLSATLSEYMLRGFDRAIAAHSGITFYSRYVDDGIIVASPQQDLEDLRAFVSNALPQTLELHRAKTRPYSFGRYVRGNPGITEHEFDFLGYALKVSEIIQVDQSRLRNVELDISPKKVAKIKRRMAKAILAFNDGGTYAHLLSRTKLLTSNFGYIDKSSGQQRFSGLRYNYSMIDPHRSSALMELDRFLINAIKSPHPGNRLRPNLSEMQARGLLGFGFKRGFLRNRFFTFREDHLRQMIGCWAHA